MGDGSKPLRRAAATTRALREDDVDGLKVDELKDVLRTMALPVSGRKADLAARVKEALAARGEGEGEGEGEDEDATATIEAVVEATVEGRAVEEAEATFAEAREEGGVAETVMETRADAAPAGNGGAGRTARERRRGMGRGARADAGHGVLERDAAGDESGRSRSGSDEDDVAVARGAHHRRVGAHRQGWRFGRRRRRTGARAREDGTRGDCDSSVLLVFTDGQDRRLDARDGLRRHQGSLSRRRDAIFQLSHDGDARAR